MLRRAFLGFEPGLLTCKEVCLRPSLSVCASVAPAEDEVLSSHAPKLTVLVMRKAEGSRRVLRQGRRNWKQTNQGRDLSCTDIFS